MEPVRAVKADFLADKEVERQRGLAANTDLNQRALRAQRRDRLIDRGGGGGAFKGDIKIALVLRCIAPFPLLPGEYSMCG